METSNLIAGIALVASIAFFFWNRRYTQKNIEILETQIDQSNRSYNAQYIPIPEVLTVEPIAEAFAGSPLEVTVRNSSKERELRDLTVHCLLRLAFDMGSEARKEELGTLESGGQRKIYFDQF
jgi:hypothetical protein